MYLIKKAKDNSYYRCAKLIEEGNGTCDTGFPNSFYLDASMWVNNV